MTCPRPCPECGKGTIHIVARAGRTCRYKEAKSLPVASHIEIPTCDTCDEEYIGDSEAEQLDAALEIEYVLWLQTDEGNAAGRKWLEVMFNKWESEGLDEYEQDEYERLIAALNNYEKTL